jgi:ubiquinone/menaquinone biosynthesis C-methylase UbiE
MDLTTSWGGRQRVAPAFRMLWSAYARVYDGLLDFYPYRKLIDTVVDRLRLTDGLRLLDIGCGTGNVMREALTRAAITIHGVDAAPAMVARARRKLATAIERRAAVVTCGEAIATLRSMPAGSFDRVCLMNVLYAVTDRDALWRECLRLLAPAGHIVATTSTKSGTLPLIREHVRHAPRWRLASPRLLAVCVFDSLICALASAGRFAFPAEDVLYAEVTAAGGVPDDGQRTYGGDTEGVNVIFTVRHPSPSPPGVPHHVQ